MTAINKTISEAIRKHLPEQVSDELKEVLDEYKSQARQIRALEKQADEKDSIIKGKNDTASKLKDEISRLKDVMITDKKRSEDVSLLSSEKEAMRVREHELQLTIMEMRFECESEKANAFRKFMLNIDTNKTVHTTRDKGYVVPGFAGDNGYGSTTPHVQTVTENEITTTTSDE